MPQRLHRRVISLMSTWLGLRVRVRVGVGVRVSDLLVISLMSTGASRFERSFLWTQRKLTSTVLMSPSTLESGASSRSTASPSPLGGTSPPPPPPPPELAPPALLLPLPLPPLPPPAEEAAALVRSCGGFGCTRTPLQ